MRSFRYSPFSFSDDSSAVRYARGSNRMIKLATTEETVETEEFVFQEASPFPLFLRGWVLDRQKGLWEARQQPVDLGQCLGRAEQHDAEEAVFRGHAESRAVDAEHAGGAQQPEHVVDDGFSRRQREL